jgi:flagellar hook-associated protein 2
MATVGINFGAATSGTGFDVTSTVNQILAVSQGIETPWNTQLTSLQAQDTALSGIGTDLSTLSTAVSALTDFQGVLAGKEGSSSDTNVLALTSASNTAIAGSHTVVVTSLASTSSNYSDEVTNTSDTLSGSLSIQIGSAAAKTIAIDSSNDTLSTLASAINNGSYGVTASVITDANGSRLSLTSSTSGSAGQITLGGALTDATTSTALSFHVGQSGADANLTVDGLPLTSASNTVTGAIPGVTFQLLSSAPSESIQIQITNNNTGVETAVQSFVTAYNTVAGDIKTQAGHDTSGNPEPLYGSPTMALIQTQLSQALNGGTASGTITSIEQLGITANPDGTLTLDVTKLDSILNSNYSDVTGYLQNTGSWGQSLSTTIDGLGNATPKDAISLELSQNATVESGLNTDISNENALIATEKSNLTTELNTANQELQAIPEQLSEVNEIYSAVTGYNQNVNG